MQNIMLFLTLWSVSLCHGITVKACLPLSGFYLPTLISPLTCKKTAFFMVNLRNVTNKANKKKSQIYVSGCMRRDITNFEKNNDKL